MRVSQRTNAFQESVIREMTRLGDEEGAVNLSQGLPEMETPPAVIAAALEAIAAGDNQYSFPFGSDGFRQAIAQRMERERGIRLDPESEVTVTCGVSEGMAAVIFALTEPGDEVIILEPWYENYVPDCVLAGVTPIFVPLARPDFTIDFERLKGAISPRTRLILLTNPHNPTGHILTGEELIHLTELCNMYDLIVVSDEIYDEIYYERKPVSVAVVPDMADRSVTLGGLGKTYSVTGWRVGWVTAAAPLSYLIRKVHDYLTICAPAPFQTAGISALNLPQNYYTAMRAKYSSCRDLLLPALEAAGFTFVWPQGAYYVLADYSHLALPEKYRSARYGMTEDRQFSEYMARQVKVAVVPGSSFFEPSTGNHLLVRFNFAKSESTLRRAIENLRHNL